MFIFNIKYVKFIECYAFYAVKLYLNIKINFKIILSIILFMYNKFYLIAIYILYDDNSSIYYSTPL